MMTKHNIGIDLGGTKISIGIVRDDGKILAQDVYDTPKTSREDILHLLQTSLQQYEAIAKDKNIYIEGIGIGTAGQINSKEGKIVSGTDNIKDWNNVELKRILSHTTTLPIYMDNDANTFALAEYYLGHGKGINHITTLTLGTGIGGGVITEGILLRGEWGGAAELGHLTVNMNGPSCNCGSRGCLETYASGTGIANRMREKIVEINDPTHPLYQKDLAAVMSKEVIDWYEQGIPEAIAVIEQAIEALAFAIISFIHTFNPSLIVLGGGLIEHNPWLLKAIKEKVYKYGMASLVQPVDIVLSKAGYDAGLIGASLLPLIADQESREKDE